MSIETHLRPEAPGEMPKRRNLQLLPAIIDTVPGYEHTVPVETVPRVVSDGEYHGGNVEAIARRSGVSADIVGKAALESVLRQLKKI